MARESLNVLQESVQQFNMHNDSRPQLENKIHHEKKTCQALRNEIETRLAFLPFFAPKK